MGKKHWKIIKIIDDYTIVINGGKNDYLQLEDELEIYKEGEAITDPDTGDLLGKLDFIKARVYVQDLFEKFAICKSDEDVVSNVMFNLTTNLNKTQTKPLNVDSSQITGYNVDTDKIIRIGDLVRKSL